MPKFRGRGRASKASKAKQSEQSRAKCSKAEQSIAEHGMAMALWSRVEQSSAKSSGVEQSGAAKSILPLRKSGKRFAILFHLAFFF